MYWVTLHPNCRLKQLFSLVSLMQAMLARRSSGKPTVGIQLLAGDGIVPLDADAFRYRHIQTLLLVEKEVVDLDVKQLLFGIDPVVAAAHCGCDLPALSCRAEFVRTGDR